MNATSHTGRPAHEIFQLLASYVYIFEVSTDILCALCSVISILGIASNIVNIIVLTRQGFSDPITTSLLGLAISDLGSVIPLVGAAAFRFLARLNLVLPFSPFDVQSVTSGATHILFSRISAWIIVFISFERLICVLFPLKVKFVITRNSTIVVIVAIFIFVIGPFLPIFYCYQLRWKFDPLRNRTVLGLFFPSNFVEIDTFKNVVQNLSTYSALVMSVISTFALTVKLNKKAVWRQSTSSNSGQKYSKRDKQVVKMVQLMSLIFVISYLPLTVLFISSSIEVELIVGGSLYVVTLMVAWFAYVFESFNAGINILIYYRISTNYRRAFHGIFSNVSANKVC